MAVTSRIPIALALTLGACGPQVTLTDDVDFTWDFALTLDRFEDNLHDPYVRGTQLRVYATSDDEDESYTGWDIRSSNPDVLLVDGFDADGTSALVSAQALAEGDVTLSVYDSKSDLVGVADVHVRTPDRVQLEAHGYLIMNRDDEAPIDDLRIVEGGTATYLVRYFRDDVELHGNGVLSGDSVNGTTAPLLVESLTSHLFEDREWLQVTAGSAGTHQVQLYADGAPLAPVPATVVPESEIADVVILSQDESGADTGNWLVLLAQAFDGAGRRIFGINYEWNVGGIMEYGVGDLYRYEFDSEVETMVIAERAGHTDSVMIHSSDGYVSSSNAVGCATSSPTGLLLPLAAAGGLLLVTSRRRRWR